MHSRVWTPRASLTSARCDRPIAAVRLRRQAGRAAFYEWFPAAYGSGSGATGVIFSGIVLNAAFYSLARAVLQWLPACRRVDNERRDHHDRCGSSDRDSGDLQCVSGGRLAADAQSLLGRECWCCGGDLGVLLCYLSTSGLPGPAALAWIVCFCILRPIVWQRVRFF